jgi:hypothetical protein
MSEKALKLRKMLLECFKTEKAILYHLSYYVSTNRISEKEAGQIIYSIA